MNDLFMTRHQATERLDISMDAIGSLIRRGRIRVNNDLVYRVDVEVRLVGAFV